MKVIATEKHIVLREVADAWQVMSGSSDQLKIRMLLSDHAAIGAAPLKCVIVLRRRTSMAGHLEGAGIGTAAHHSGVAANVVATALNMRDRALDR